MKSLVIRTIYILIFLISSLEAQPVSSFPNTSDFEGVSLGNWRQSIEDDIDFTVHTGGTASSGTGPSSDRDWETTYRLCF